MSVDPEDNKKDEVVDLDVEATKEFVNKIMAEAPKIFENIMRDSDLTTELRKEQVETLKSIAKSLSVLPEINDSLKSLAITLPKLIP